MPPPDSHPHRSRTGLSRLWHATGYSIAGLRAAWSEKAFRQEVLIAIVLLPLAFWLGQGWLETVVLLSVTVLVLITELLNSAVEAAIDRFGGELHPLSKRAKDLGSAAVLLSLLIAAGAWLIAAYHRFSSHV
ncbi:MAG: diacylglycerol kinase [Comamonas sp. SCN 65-56]|uniref:diacylglycerol kinase n=1 Tax=Comamonas sp. SCN 65-56 TaxID=1660095 RepID=UPI00086B6E3B|nr:diacylglycerol kinase [Comamonas sp. SCN 65-56]ODS91604.1 MAG: diacylglycerol kinase [Comamonas sp. SCN 65-56]